MKKKFNLPVINNDENSPSKKKPEEITEIENYYGILLSQESMEYLLSIEGRGRLKNFFVVNEKNEIIALAINSLDREIKIKEITALHKLNKLIYLSLTRNNIEDISSLELFPGLEYLYLGANKIENINSLAQLKKLKELAIWDNQITDFTPLSHLINLEKLFCQNTSLVDLDFVASLQNLNELNVRNNKIKDINILVSLNNLTYLDLFNNEIEQIPIEVANKIGLLNDPITSNHHLNIKGNPLQLPPSSVLELGRDSVKTYYSALNEFGHAPLSEGRVIVVGDGSAGKSSLIQRVLYNTFDQGKSQTNGIFIENWKLKRSDDRLLTFHIWDFGGQEIQHAVHKFFFTDGCLYVLVLDNRKEEEPEYWLQQIESLGGKAPVLVVFNKQDDHVIEIADRKFLKEKYPNIVGFYNTSCKTGLGIDIFKKELEENVVKLQTVDEQFPNNWFKIKKTIEECTSGQQHYLDYESYSRICSSYNTASEKIQKLLLKYLTTIGAITWFGDTYLNFLHVLSPKWITQGVYKIITSKKTANLLGNINISDFEELLQPSSEKDYSYDKSHYGYILSVMKKFDLCYTPDYKSLLIPSAFEKIPKVEYSEFRGEDVRTYILLFKDYMPQAIIHRFIAKKLPHAYQNNYWYSGIVIKDNKSSSLSMIHADKESKRIYIRIKGTEKLGIWEHVRRELHDIISNYAAISFSELVSLDDTSENTVTYQDLVSHITVNKSIYFHPKLQQDFNVGYLIGLFENKENTLAKFRSNGIEDINTGYNQTESTPPNFVINILNNNSPTVNTQINTEINIDIDINIVNNLSSEIKGEAEYLLESIEEKNPTLSDALKKIIQFADDAKSARNSGAVIEKGWGRKLKSIIQTLSNAGENLKNIQDGKEALSNLMTGLYRLISQFPLSELKTFFDSIS